MSAPNALENFFRVAGFQNMRSESIEGLLAARLFLIGYLEARHVTEILERYKETVSKRMHEILSLPAKDSHPALGLIWGGVRETAVEWMRAHLHDGIGCELLADDAEAEKIVKATNLTLARLRA